MSRYRPRQFAKGSRDRNEEEIKAVLRAAGVKYLILSPGQGADLLLVVNPVAFVEVKNGADAKLTETEKAMKWHCEAEGIGYWIVRTPAETAAMLNSRKRGMMTRDERVAKAANNIINELFTSEYGKSAMRLKLILADGKDGGWWGKFPARDIVAKHIAILLQEETDTDPRPPCAGSGSAESEE